MAIRLHILGIPHTITRDEYSHCAFTGKVLRFCPMMMSVGFEVYHYGIESSQVEATKNIEILSLYEWEHLRRVSYKYLHPEMTEEEIETKLGDKKSFVGDLANLGTILYKEFNARARQELIKNYRGKNTDIVCLPFGKAHNAAIVDLPFVVVESGIGYNGSYLNYRIFESYAFKHFELGNGKINHSSNYWFVVPNYYNVAEFPLSMTPKRRIGFFGRICHIKGMNVVVEIALRFPDIEFVICGQGDPTPYITDSEDGKKIAPKNLIYKPPIHGDERGEFLGSLTALLCPSLYVEPFCGVNVEAQLCGTPVIANDFGVFNETVEEFKTGVLCHTLQDFIHGVQMALDGKFDRQYIAERARKKYNMYNLAHRYSYVFRSILDIYNGNNGWYSGDNHLEEVEEMVTHPILHY